MRTREAGECTGERGEMHSVRCAACAVRQHIRMISGESIERADLTLGSHKQTKRKKS